MIIIPPSCQNLLNTVIHGNCFFGQCDNLREVTTSQITAPELDLIQRWILKKYNLYIEFPISLITLEHIMHHLKKEVLTL